MIAGATIFVLLALSSAFLPDQKGMDGLARLIAIGLLFSWYFASARHQTAYVKARFGKTYPRKGWLKPLALAVLAFIGFVLAAGLGGLLFGVLFGRA